MMMLMRRTALGRREVAESCFDYLAMAMVDTYCSRRDHLLLLRLHHHRHRHHHHHHHHHAARSEVKPELPGRRIESVGYQVGSQLVERYTKERPWFSDHLEAIKFICKDFWAEIFKKQVDNLKTNHRGVFVLQDNQFRWLTHISLDAPPDSVDEASAEASISDNAVLAARAASDYLYFPCGLIRGALTNIGVPCDVSAEVVRLPACSFVVRIKA